MLGDLPPTKILGVKPFIIGSDPTFELSQEILKAAKTMEAQAIKYLHEFGIQTRKKDNRDLQEIAHLSYKGF